LAGLRRIQADPFREHHQPNRFSWNGLSHPILKDKNLQCKHC